MRTFVVFSMFALVATLGYMFGPELIEAYDEREALVAESQVVAVVQDANQADGATFETKRDGGAGIRASLTHLRQSVAGVAKKPKPSHEKAKAKARPAAKRRTAQAERDELRRLGLTPALADSKVAETGKSPSARRAVYSPMAHRWIDDLSGPKARMDMGLKSRRDGCADAYSHCERPAAPRDIAVAGVVVRSETIVRRPTEPLKGRVRQGHYIEATPAVYVE